MKQKIAVYGLSLETGKHLPELAGKYEIVGLLDSYRSEGIEYGYAIIPIDEVISKHIDKIIVVARPGSCKVIAKRIGNICHENKIELLDIRGKNLLQTKTSTFDFKAVKGYTKKQLFQKIDGVEAVSFDLFDTLVMRQVMTSSNVLEIMNAQLQMEGMFICDFVTRRMAVEKEMSQGYAPKLEEIYAKVLRDQNVGIGSEKLAAKEFELDKQLLIPRVDMLNMLCYAKKKHKKIYITSDSYYTKDQIMQILVKNEVVDYDDIFVSCEYGTSKQSGLFDELKKVANTDKLLHIGDDIVADVESGEKNGLETFRIYNSAELFELVGEFGLKTDSEEIADKIKIGMFLTHIFNSPFQFEEDEKSICINDDKELGYLFFAPLIFDFVEWFGTQIKKYNCNNVWFCSRDGYLIKKIYELIYKGQRSDYFLTSRTAAIRAGIENEDDIITIDTMKYFGSVVENLKSRFGIDVAEIQEEDINKNKKGLLSYEKTILKVADQKRENNKKYISNLAVEQGKIAFFDFVAKGTCQAYTRRLVDNPLLGLYFLQLEPEYAQKEGIEIIPFYTENEREKSFIFDDYYILETILTAPDPSVNEFDRKGRPIYAQETRKKEDIECFMNVQQGIWEYVRDYLAICPDYRRIINKSLDESLLKLLHCFKLNNPRFTELKIEDPFFNRVTNIQDVI